MKGAQASRLRLRPRLRVSLLTLHRTTSRTHLGYLPGSLARSIELSASKGPCALAYLPLAA
eukprot:15104456-Alexandrium_andersonii.AAC.1